MNPFGLGAHESSIDNRTWQHPVDLATPLPLTGGYQYSPQDIEHQHTVGICTAISLIQNAEKALNKKYSPEFQYLLQKKYIDGNWIEGSSIFSALKVGKTYGFLPLELFTYASEDDRNLPYSEYIAKLQAIPDVEITRLIGLCINKLSGYAQLPTDGQSIARGILDSKAGILTRYSIDSHWWSPSWLSRDIDPLEAPTENPSGHAIGTSYFDFTTNQTLEHPNTWGTVWNFKGKGHTIHNKYSCTEAWIPYYDSIITPVPSIPKYQFTVNFGWGSWRFTDVYNLQKILIAGKYVEFSNATGLFGSLTFEGVKKYQLAHTIPDTGFVGPLTIASLNLGV